MNHSQDPDAAFHVEAVRAIYRKALYGPYDLTPADQIDSKVLAKSIKVATGRDVEGLVIISASGMYPDQGRPEEYGDLAKMLQQATVGKDSVCRLSSHISMRHGWQSSHRLHPDVRRRLGLSIRDGGLGFQLPRSIRAGYGGALINRLNRESDVGVDGSLAETLISNFSYTVHACLHPFLSYTLKEGAEEGMYTLMPLIERLEHSLPLCTMPGNSGIWLVIGG